MKSIPHPIVVLLNAKIHTLALNHPECSALAIQGQYILATGSDEELKGAFPEAERLDLGGRAVLPGLHDAHIHLDYFSLGLQKVDCETQSKAECLRRVAERVASSTPGKWVLGHGWNQNLWGDLEGEFPSAAELDAIAPRNPVYLTAKSLHAGWANSLALREADITSNTPNPPDGRYQHSKDGRLTGILFEGAMEVMNRALPEPTGDELVQAFLHAQENLMSMGLTSLQDFDGARCFAALQELQRRGELRLRVTKSIPLENLDKAIDLGLRSGFGNDHLRIGALKLFADGALGPHTAAMIEPYEGEQDERGILLLDGETMFDYGRRAVEHGIRITVHAIGDRANHEMLNAYAQIRDYERAHHLPALRHRIEHVQLIHPQDVGRLAELNIIASMQPIHATSDMDIADKYWGRRAAFSYAWRTLKEQGTPLAFGSDAPVENPNPFWGLHAAVTRRRADGSPAPDGWYPDQRLTFMEALQGFTCDAAYAAGREDALGRLAPGYLADLIVLDDDPFVCDPDALRDMLPCGVMIDGEWVVREFS